jgi:hypothetical protein
MIQPETIARMDPGLEESIKAALMTLSATGVLLEQVLQNKLPLLESFNDDAQTLVTRIIDAQQINRVLLGLHELGQQYLEERKNA